MKRFLNFILSSVDSVKEVISLLSFAAFITIVIYTLKHDYSPQNASVLRDALKYLCGIVMVGVFSVGAVEIFQAFKKNGE